MPTETMEKHRLVATLNSPRRKGLTRSYTHKGKDIYSGFAVACILVAGDEKGFIVTNIHDEFSPVGRAQGDVRLFGSHKSEEV